MSVWESVLTVLAIGSGMVILSSFLFYEILRLTWDLLDRIRWHPRFRILIVIFAIFGTHTLIVWCYGFVFWALYHLEHYGSFASTVPHALDYDTTYIGMLYFSAATYSSLGLGDIVPTGALRLLTGIEVLNGLVLIGWSITFAYLAMQRFWEVHSKHNKKGS